MAETTQIAWTHRRNPLTGMIEPGATVNFWIGCTEVSDECAGCYAKGEDAVRGWTPGGWGRGKPRYKVQGVFNTIKTLNRKALKLGMRLAAFTNSLADMFDQEISLEWREEAFAAMEAAPAVDFMILTKRAKEMHDFIWTRYGDTPPDNLWLGVSAGRQKAADVRIPILKETPCTGCRFVSAEPLLELVDFNRHVNGIDLLIIGGESEHRGRPGYIARAMDPNWVRFALEAAFPATGPVCAVHFKQWGEWAPLDDLGHNPQAKAMALAGNVQSQRFQGRRVFKVGKHAAGNSIDGVHWMQQPPIKALPGGALV